MCTRFEFQLLCAQQSGIVKGTFGLLPMHVPRHHTQAGHGTLPACLLTIAAFAASTLTPAGQVLTPVDNASIAHYSGIVKRFCEKI